MENDHYPMPRTNCGAKTRKGGSCRQPAMKNGRCRLHGGKSLSGKDHGRYCHGMRTKESMELRQELAELMRETRELMREV